MPNLNLFRPADAKETIAAYESAFKTKKPTAIVLSRQDLPVLAETSSEAAKGGYVVYGEENTDAILLSTGSEVSLCIAAAKKLFEEGVKVRVVSLPSFNKFFEQSKEYREKVLPKGIKNRMAVEAASSLSWGGLVGLDGEYLCIDCFGESGKPEDLKIKFSMTEEEICKRVKKMVRE
jgi:transketolase